MKLLLGAIAALALVLAGCGSSKQPPALKAIAYTKSLGGNKQEVWIARPDGSHKRRLAAGRLPALSPDGRWVAFEGACDPTRGCGDLFVVPSSGGEPRRLQGDVAQIEWSPDSKRMLAYHPVSENGGRLLVLDREHRRRIVIARGGLNGWSSRRTVRASPTRRSAAPKTTSMWSAQTEARPIGSRTTAAAPFPPGRETGSSSPG